jgi:SAM-dependent methyltransferase
VRAAAAWAPTKFVPGAGAAGWVPNPAYVRPASLWACERLLGPMVEALRGHARGRLLDAGCGEVPYFGIYSHLVSDITCLDWPASTHGARHVDLVADLNAGLPLAEGTFETVLLADVLEHVAEPAVLMRGAGRVLAPGGALIASVPFLYWVHEAPHDYFRYTAFALRRLCAGADLEPVSLRAWGGLPDVLIDLAGKAVVRGELPGRMYAATGRAVASTAAFRRWRRATIASFPLGYVMVARRV